MKKIDFIKLFWRDIYAVDSCVEDVTKQYLHQDYSQCINGVSMVLSDYIHHVEAQKQGMTITSIDYQHSLENEDELFALYLPKGVNKQGELVEAEVIAHFLFQAQKILHIHGQVRLITGGLSDVDMKA